MFCLMQATGKAVPCAVAILSGTYTLYYAANLAFIPVHAPPPPSKGKEKEGKPVGRKPSQRQA